MSEELAVYKTGMPSMTIQDAIIRYNTVIEFTRKVMKKNKDYGTIPGSDKPTLLKPGAEKLCSLFGLTPYFVPLSEAIDFEKGFFYVRYRCELTRGGEIVATGVGSCNSREKKYRYRNIPEWKATEAEKAAAIRKEPRKDKNGKPFNMLVIENQDPADLLNTIDKMAQKRALIAATLIAANASEFFTQDVEDMEIINGEYHEELPMPSISATPEMSLETAMSVTGSDGRKYGEIDTATLSHMANSITKKLKENGLDGKKREEYEYKLSAIRVLLSTPDRPEPGIPAV